MRGVMDSLSLDESYTWWEKMLSSEWEVGTGLW